MGIFSRLSDIVNSNLNAILASAEDPQKIIRLVIQEMEDTLVEVRSQTVRTIAERRELGRRVEGLARDEAEWARKAELALSRGREDLARMALQARLNAGRAREAAQGQLDQVAEGLAAQSDDIARLQAKLTDARSREKSLATRGKIAAGRLQLRASLHDQRVADAFERFETVERRLDEAEGRVEAYDVGRGGAKAGGPVGLEAELAGLESEAAVEDELAAMKRRLGGTKDGGAG
ncbi:MAG: phage shock protein PspA [Janthinobacterium lividum]